MSRRIRYFIWNKTADFGTGWGKNVCFTDEGMYPYQNSSGIYISRVLDSGESGKKWHRAEMSGVFPEGTMTEITFFASDTKEYDFGGNRLSLEQLLLSTELTEDEKLLLTLDSTRQTFRNCDDILMDHVHGRYLWYMVRMESTVDCPQLTQLRIWLDDFSWLSYLPEIYSEDAQGADFTARFLGIFQNLYEEMHEKINSIPSYYDLERADRDFLEWLADWTGMENIEIWSDEQLRRLLKQGRTLYRSAGTADMIASITELYTGIRPVILENYYAADASSAVRAWRTGSWQRDPFSFTLILPKNAVSSEAEHRALLTILRHSKPAHMRMQLIFTSMDGSADDLPRTICLDGRTALM